jgi:hypothetical protein
MFSLMERVQLAETFVFHHEEYDQAKHEIGLRHALSNLVDNPTNSNIDDAVSFIGEESVVDIVMALMTEQIEYNRWQYESYSRAAAEWRNELPEIEPGKENPNFVRAPEMEVEFERGANAYERLRVCYQKLLEALKSDGLAGLKGSREHKVQDIYV